MPLTRIEISVDAPDLPNDVRAILSESNTRVERYITKNPIRVSGSVPSDFAIGYHVPRAIVNEFNEKAT